MKNPFQVKQDPIASANLQNPTVASKKRSNWAILSQTNIASKPSPIHNHSSSRSDNESSSDDSSDAENQAALDNQKETEKSSQLITACTLKSSTTESSSSAQSSLFTKRMYRKTSTTIVHQQKSKQLGTKKSAVEDSPADTTVKRPKLEIAETLLSKDLFGFCLFSSVSMLSRSKPALNIDSLMTYFHFHPNNVTGVLSPFHGLDGREASDKGLEWKDSLISLYHLWKLGETQLFYFFHADEFTCAFHKEDAINEESEIAVIDKSCVNLCKSLIKDGFLLDISKPGRIIASADYEQTDCNPDEYARLVINDPAKVTDQMIRRRPLVFRGGYDVNLLYDFLLNCNIKTFSNRRMQNCNRYLLSTIPFRYATMDQLNISQGTQVTRLVNGKEEGDGKYWQIQINGPIFPMVLYKIIDSGIVSDIAHEIEIIPTIIVSLYQKSSPNNSVKKITRRPDGKCVISIN